MSEILSDRKVREFAIGLAASQRIILERLFQAGLLEREEVVQDFHEKARDLIENQGLDDAANLLRLIHREIPFGEPGE